MNGSISTHGMALRQFMLAATALAGLALCAGTAMAESLTIGLNGPPTSMDPHYHNAAANAGPLSHVFEPLVFLGADRGLSPGLAVSWEAIGDTVWEFRLRDGVTFHDGSPFTAEDVVFSLERVRVVPSPSSYALYIAEVEEMEIVDPLTIRFHTSIPLAEFPVGLTQIQIMSHTAGAGSAAEGRTTEELNQGQGTVGTGPYRFVEYVPNEQVTLTANPDYWDGAPPWDDVTLRVISAGTSRAAALLSGEIDAAALPGETVESIEARDDIDVTVAESCYFTYLALDQHETTPQLTGVEGANPLLDARVREALSVAINREGIAERVMSGYALAASELGAPTLFGASPDRPVDAYDPERARALLAEAGYPDGFGITLNTIAGGIAGDVQVAQAIAAMWTQAGVETAVDSMTGSVFYQRRNNLEYSAYITHFCAFNGQMSYSLRLLGMQRNPDAGYGQVNRYNYHNPEVDRLLIEAFATIDDAAREALVRQASDIVVDQDFGVLAIIRHRAAYAARAGLDFQPRIDTFLTAMQLTPAN